MPDSIPLPRCSVLLLSGGRGQRMGGADKGLLDWQGHPLIAWLHQLVRPLTDDLIISCNRNADYYKAFADRLVTDGAAGFQGPLAGIRAGLQAAHHPYLLVLPCDAPLLDMRVLLALLKLVGEQPVVVSQGGFIEPLFCVIPRAQLANLEVAWQAGERSPQRWLHGLNPLIVEYPAKDPRFANLNTPELLTQR
ncbi:molybdenum cofactor guanylyltransferase MobA [Pseudomonas sp. TMP9]|uniref:molybdenum cofactor guanylyltransferase MobA n=1 Tax=unclassified Pseudomonas TaxID=196821 RepID=UPI0030CF04FB